jgi:hypothetical protein
MVVFTAVLHRRAYRSGGVPHDTFGVARICDGGVLPHPDAAKRRKGLGKRKEILIPSVLHRPVGVAAPSGGEQTKGWIKVSASLMGSGSC